MANEAIITKPYKVEHHFNADKLDILTMNGEGGFTCVSGRDQFTPDSLVLYIEPDSVIPDNIKEHLEKTSKIKVSNRIRAIKLRGVISEGLCLPPDLFLPAGTFKEGDDVSERLNIKHYQPPPPKGQGWKSVKGSNPWYQNKKFKVYNHIDRFEKVCSNFNEDMNVHISTKLHGMNHRVSWCEKEAKTWWQRLGQKIGLYPKWEYLIGSHRTVRNVGKKGKPLPPEMEGQDYFIRAANQYNMKAATKAISKEYDGKNVTIYSELIGWGMSTPLQKGYWYGIPEGEVELRVFDIMVDGKYIDMKDVFSLCKKYNLPHVDTLYEGPFSLDLLKLAEEVDEINDWKGNREGIVIKVQPATHSPKMGYMVAKKINPKYLISKDNSEYH